MLFLMLKSYFVGSIPFAFIFTRLARKLDIRKIGSGNVGTTNVFKQVGPLPAFLTAIGDGCKGLIAVMIGSAVGSGGELIALLVAVIGHNWPVWLKFHGGGGLATLIGGMLFITEWWVVPVLLSLWGLIYLLIREYKRSVLLTCSLLPFVLGWIHSSWKSFLFGLGAGFLLGLKNLKSLLAETAGKTA